MWPAGLEGGITTPTGSRHVALLKIGLPVASEALIGASRDED
jgi:hypothetical protein